MNCESINATFFGFVVLASLLQSSCVFSLTDRYRICPSSLTIHTTWFIFAKSSATVFLLHAPGQRLEIYIPLLYDITHAKLHYDTQSKSCPFIMHAAPDQRKVLEPPLHMLFAYLKEEKRIRIHLNQNPKMIIEGKIVGFDEFMNIVLDDAYEIYLNTKSRAPLGTTMLRGECVGIVHEVPHVYE